MYLDLRTAWPGPAHKKSIGHQDICNQTGRAFKRISLEGNAENVIWENTVSYYHAEKKEIGAHGCSLQEQNKLMIKKIWQFIFFLVIFWLFKVEARICNGVLLTKCVLMQKMEIL